MNEAEQRLVDDCLVESDALRKRLHQVMSNLVALCAVSTAAWYFLEEDRKAIAGLQNHRDSELRNLRVAVGLYRQLPSLHDRPTVPCLTCDGTGRIENLHGGLAEPTVHRCTACSGTGTRQGGSR